MKSMTGYGSAGVSTTKLDLELSVKAVNGRFLEVRFHGPREYSSFDAEVRRVVGRIFVRGTVDVYCSRRLRDASEAADVIVRHAMAKKWQKAYQDLAKSLKLKTKPDLEMIARAPDVVGFYEGTQASDEERKQVLKLIEKAARACDDERKREGLALQNEMNRLLLELEGHVTAIAKLREAANRELEGRYRERLERLGLSTTVDAQRLSQEIIMQLDRTDITEEVQRLAEHVATFRKAILDEQSQGKKLDFYAQELLREVNTIGSKSHLAALTHLVVESKTLIERIREQVQNAE